MFRTKWVVAVLSLPALLLPFWSDRTERAWRSAVEDRWSEFKRAVKTAWDRQV